MTLATARDWDLARYAAFGDLRRRPAIDLFNRVAVEQPRLVVDLGCGAGVIAEALRARAPGARLVGVDPSPGMRRRRPASMTP